MIIPNFRISGVLAVIVGLLILLWSALFLKRRPASLVLLLLGGGFAPIFPALFAAAMASAVHRPLDLWRKRLPAPLRRLLARIWSGVLISFLVLFAIAVEIAIFGYPLRWLVDADTTPAILNILSYLMVGLMLLSVLTVIGFDVEQTAGKEGFPR